MTSTAPDLTVHHDRQAAGAAIEKCARVFGPLVAEAVAERIRDGLAFPGLTDRKRWRALVDEVQRMAEVRS